MQNQPSGKENVFISLIVPMKNECSCVEELFARVRNVFDKKFKGRWEILMIDDGSTEKSSPELLAKEQQIEEEEKREPEKGLQLVHRSSFWKVKNNRSYYRIIVSLDSRDPRALADVERVVYYLHKSFENPIREVTDPRKRFAMKTAAWGEFTMRADVFLRGKTEPLRLSRYVSIQP